jgi:thioredoxin-related protein
MVGFRWSVVLAAACCLLVLVTSGASGQRNGAERIEIAWQTDYAAAHQQRVRDGRPMLVFLTTDGCPYCQKMLRATYNNVHVSQTISQHFVPTYINGTKQPVLAKQFGVRLYPTTFLIGPDNRILDKIEGYAEPAVIQQKMDSIAHRMAAQPTSETTK